MYRITPLLKTALGIALVFLVGTVGYSKIEGWPLLDSFYMTVITLTTVGFSEVRPLSSEGRIFTVLIIFVGMGFFAHLVVLGTRMVVEGEIRKIITGFRFMKAIQKVHDHFIVCGFGRMGSYICEELHQRGKPFVVVEKNPATQEKIAERGFLFAKGDATDEAILRTAGIETARGLVAVLDSDAENVYAVLTARELQPGLEIIARATDEGAEKKLKRAGADRVISPYHIGGKRMVMSILKPTVTSFLEIVTSYGDLNVDIEEVQVSHKSPYAGKRLVDTEIRKDLDLIVIAMKRSNGDMVFNPGPDAEVRAGDILIAMGRMSNLRVFRKKAQLGTSSPDDSWER